MDHYSAGPRGVEEAGAENAFRERVHGGTPHAFELSPPPLGCDGLLLVDAEEIPSHVVTRTRRLRVGRGSLRQHTLL